MNARNSLKGLAVSSDSEPEVKPFITQTKAASFAGAENEEAVDNFNFRTEDRPTCMFTDKEDSGRGSLL